MFNLCSFGAFLLVVLYPRGGGVLLEKLGRSVRPTSQNPYPVYDQNGAKTAEKPYLLGPHIPI